MYLVFILLGCSRDITVGIENLPKDSHFSLRLGQTDPSHAEFSSQWKDNIWLFNDIPRGSYQLGLFYGENQCQLTSPTFDITMGFGMLYHKSDWSCPGVIGYETVLIENPSGTNFYMGKSEVTVGLWQQISGEDSEDPCGVGCPKSKVSWIHAINFANQLSIQEGLEQCYSTDQEKKPVWNKSCDGWRLPTDEEWSLAASDGKTKYAGSDDPKQVGWYKENSEMTRHPVCQLQPNHQGICDMTGNVWEWNWDPSIKDIGLRRVRGGGFSSRDDVALLSNKIDFPRHIGADHIGFRLVRNQ